MLKKRLLSSVLLSAVVLVSAVGCGGTKEPAKDAAQGDKPAATEDAAKEPAAEGETPATGDKKVAFWLDKLGQADVAQQVQEQWTKDSGVEVTIQPYPDTASYQTAIQQVIDQPDAPGLFTWWSGSQLETLVKNGKVEDISAEWDKYIADGVSADIKNAFTIDGKVYAAPYSILYNVVLYNKDAFTKAGITEEPKTFDEFLAACEKLKAAGITPIGLKNDSWASFIWFQQMLASYDPQLYIDICSGAKKYTDPDVKKVMEIWKGMFDKGYFAQPILFSDNYKALAQGTVAMSLEPSTEVALLAEQFGTVSGTNIDALTLPSMSGKKNVIFFEATPICVATSSSSKEAAIEAMRGFYKPDTQKIMVERTGIANTSKVELTDPVINKVVQMSSDPEKYQLILRYYENTPEDLRNFALDELSKFMYSGAPIDDILNSIQGMADKTFAK